MKIGIFTAMKKEAASFLQGEVTHSVVGAFDVYTFKLGSHDAVLCCPPSVGEIAASAACQLLISQLHADVIVNFGIVGALSAQVGLLSTVYVGSVVHYAMDVSQIDNLPVGRYAFFDDVSVPCDETLLAKALHAQKLPVVRCASADAFVGSPSQKAALNRDFGAQVCDMEAAGVLFACKFNNVPCLLVKCVSDSLTDTLASYEQNALRATEKFFAFAKQLANVL